LKMSEKKKKSGEDEAKTGLGPMSRREFTIASVAILGTASGPGAPPGVVIAGKPVQNDDKTGSALPLSARQSASASARNITLTVNKWKYELYVEPESVLRDVLRDRLGLVSIKDMCNGYGACGSCTVIADGRPVLSCMTLAVECDGMTVETAEGVAETKPELIEAYVMNHCMQCGYCTPGFIVTAKALLDRFPNPTEKDIKEALGGNICRCGTYPRHAIAVLEAAKNSA
jgi:aerobic-type carbon monoxide dehydrogenase small subunit (CoxS/CutS family)